MIQKTLKEQLINEYPYKIELHAHTKPVSPCSEISPTEMVETYNKKGYNGIAITNHFIEWMFNDKTKEDSLNYYLSDFEETKKEAEKYGIKVYLGIELRFNENNNDYLIYGADREILSICYDNFHAGIEKFRKEIKLPNSVFIQAHPFRDGMELVDPDLLDGIETFNLHPGHNSRVALAARYAKENNILIKTAGSDFHHPDKGHEAVSALRTKVLPEDSFELAEILKSGDYIFEIGEDSILIP
ncbi:MAG: PHP domain-containing protein [Ruminococcaceae bacterium]|nr:PHP domain-containing protein [Oscillospiraceae bacterium]